MDRDEERSGISSMTLSTVMRTTGTKGHQDRRIRIEITQSLANTPQVLM